MNDPLVSVCIPVFNARRYIGETLESAVSQDAGSFEIIVCEDGSRDAVKDIIDGMGDPRIRYLSFPENLGLAGNWNRTLEQARGEWIKFLFQDDLFSTPASLGSFLSESMKSQDCDFLFSACDQIDASSRYIRSHRPFKMSRTFMPQDMVPLLLFSGNQIGGPSNVLIRRSLFSRVGGFDARSLFALDLFMWIRMAARSHIRYIDLPLIRTREHPDSATARLTEEQITLVDHHAMFSLLKGDGLVRMDLIEKAEDRFMKRIRRSIIISFLTTGRWPSHIFRQYRAIRKRSRGGTPPGEA